MDELMERYQRHAAGEVSLGDRLAGAVWGHLVGDAVGVPYEFGPALPVDEVRFGASGTHGQSPGTWSDDGALMLALLDSLLEVGFDTTDQAQRALAWYRGTAYTPAGEGRFDIGNATRASLDRLEAGMPAEEAGADPDALGNGSLMRILPLALVERETSDAELVEHAHRASAVTHGELDARVPCALYVLIARRLLAGSTPRGAMEDARSSLRRLYSDQGLDTGYVAALDRLEAWPDRSGRGLVTDSFWSAWDAISGADSYQQTIQRAVAYGNDTDTTAAIAGGLAGIYWGIDGIHPDWLAGMRDRQLVWPLVLRLVGRAGYRSDEIPVDWVDAAQVPGLSGAKGRLGMTFLPGKRDLGLSGDHWRALEQDAAALRAAHGVDRFVLLVGDDELAATRVRDIEKVLAQHEIELMRYPIGDMGVPSDAESFSALLADLRQWLADGQKVVVACRGGMGRTGTVVGSVLRGSGLDGEAAIALTRDSRPGTIETSKQEEFVRDWPGKLAAERVSKGSLPNLP